MRVQRFLGVPLAALLLAASGCGGSDDGGSDSASADKPSQSSSPSQGKSQQPSAAEPDTSDVPEVVAEVNGEEIGKDEFLDTYEPQYQQMAMQSKAAGKPVNEGQLQKQVVDNLVNVELLVQEAEKRDFGASDQQVQKSMESLAKQNGMQSADQFVAALEKQGMDRESIEAQAADQVLIEQLLADEGADKAPGEKQVRAFYDSLKAQQKQAGKGGQKLPPYQKIKPQLEQQLVQQQQSKIAQTLLGQLHKDAEVQVHL